MALTFGKFPSCLRIEVKEMNICGELLILSLIYSYVAVCRFCAVLRLIIICSVLLFSNYSTFFLLALQPIVGLYFAAF